MNDLRLTAAAIMSPVSHSRTSSLQLVSMRH